MYSSKGKPDTNTTGHNMSESKKLMAELEGFIIENFQKGRPCSRLIKWRKEALEFATIHGEY